MKSKILTAGMLGLFLLTMPALAHHSFQAEFSVEKPVTLTGVVSKVEWINPHAQIYLDVKDATGKASQWRISTWDPFVLRHAGLTRNSIGIGQEVNLTAYAAKDGANIGYLRHIKLQDGQEFDLWDSTSNQAIQAAKKAAEGK